jgi:hypothetical protein
MLRSEKNLNSKKGNIDKRNITLVVYFMGQDNEFEGKEVYFPITYVLFKIQNYTHFYIFLVLSRDTVCVCACACACPYIFRLHTLVSLQWI